MEGPTTVDHNRGTEALLLRDDTVTPGQTAQRTLGSTTRLEFALKSGGMHQTYRVHGWPPTAHREPSHPCDPSMCHAASMSPLPSPFQARPSSPEDAADLAEVERLAGPYPWRLDAIRGSLDAGRAGILIEDDSGPCAHIILQRGSVGEVLTLAVAPRAKRQGLGRYLIAAAIRDWRSDGLTEAWLDVRRDNVAACGLYRSTGWVEAGVRRAYYRDGCDALVLTRALDA